MGINLLELPPGAKAKVLNISGNGPLKRRLIEMGLVKGLDIELKRIAPFGGPVEIILRGYHLSLRKEEASCIYVKTR